MVCWCGIARYTFKSIFNFVNAAVRRFFRVLYIFFKLWNGVLDQERKVLIIYIGTKQRFKKIIKIYICHVNLMVSEFLVFLALL